MTAPAPLIAPSTACANSEACLNAPFKTSFPKPSALGSSSVISRSLRLVFRINVLRIKIHLKEPGNSLDRQASRRAYHECELGDGDKSGCVKFYHFKCNSKNDRSGRGGRLIDARADGWRNTSSDQHLEDRRCGFSLFIRDSSRPFQDRCQTLPTNID